MDDVRWLDADEREAWLGLVRTVMRLPTALDAQLQRDAGVTFFEYSVLAMLSEQPDGTLGMSDLAELASGSLSRLSHVVSRMERRGLVARSRVPGAGRRTDVAITGAGTDLIVAAAPAHVEHVRRLVVDALDADQRAALRGVGAQVVARLEEQ